MMQRSEFHPFDGTQICYKSVGLTDVADGNYLAVQFDFECRPQRRIGKRCLTHALHRLLRRFRGPKPSIGYRHDFNNGGRDASVKLVTTTRRLISPFWKAAKKPGPPVRRA